MGLWGVSKYVPYIPWDCQSVLPPQSLTPPIPAPPMAESFEGGTGLTSSQTGRGWGGEQGNISVGGTSSCYVFFLPRRSVHSSTGPEPNPGDWFGSGPLLRRVRPLLRRVQGRVWGHQFLKTNDLGGQRSDAASCPDAPARLVPQNR